MATEPHWEKGWRCWGYWCDLDRVAGVVVPWRKDPKPWSWGWMVRVPLGYPGRDRWGYVEGKAPGLAQAKAECERVFREAWPGGWVPGKRDAATWT